MYNRILVPVDLNDESSWRTALPVAVGLCEKFGATLDVMTVVPDFVLPSVAQFFPDDYTDKALAETRTSLDALIADQVPAAAGATAIIAYGTPYTEILRVAKETKPDLIVMASHRPELKDYLLGPNAARVVRHADCSVQVVRD